MEQEIRQQMADRRLAEQLAEQLEMDDRLLAEQLNQADKNREQNHEIGPFDSDDGFSGFSSEKYESGRGESEEEPDGWCVSNASASISSNNGAKNAENVHLISGGIGASGETGDSKRRGGRGTKYCY